MMKEVYTAPELRLLCFASRQDLAVSFDDLLNPGSGSGSNIGLTDNADPSMGDIPMDIGV